MQVCTSLQTDNQNSNPPLSFFTGRMPFLPPNQYADDTILENKFNLTEENPTAIKKNQQQHQWFLQR